MSRRLFQHCLPRRPLQFITCNAEARIPACVHELEKFRKWAESPEYPNRGRFHYLQGDLWVETDIEELFTHNLLQMENTIEIGRFLREAQRGYLFSDGLRLSNAASDLSSEPDAIFASFDAIQSNRVKLVRGRVGGYVELEGSPELIVEIVSCSSIQKDNVLLRTMYAEAGVAEYWIVDARRPAVQFELLVLGASGYSPAEVRGGAPVSPLLQQPVSIGQSVDPLGKPRFIVTVG